MPIDPKRTAVPTLSFPEALPASTDPTPVGKSSPVALQIDVTLGLTAQDPVCIRVTDSGGRAQEFRFADQHTFRQYMNDQESLTALVDKQLVTGVAGQEALLERARQATDVRAAAFQGGENLFAPEDAPLPSGLATPSVGPNPRLAMSQRRKEVPGAVPASLGDAGTVRAIPRGKPEDVVRANPVLRQVSAPAGQVDDGVRRLAGDMLATLRAAGHGVALAAPQIGVGQRVIVTRYDDSERVFINPRIVARGEKQGDLESLKNLLETEGCMSLSKVQVSIDRSDWVILQAVDIDGQPFRVRFDGFMARIVQHEIDHLNGVLISDRAGRRQPDPPS